MDGRAVDPALEFKFFDSQADVFYFKYINNCTLIFSFV